MPTGITQCKVGACTETCEWTFGEFGLCQEHWEAYSSSEYWKAALGEESLTVDEWANEEETCR